MPQPDKAPEESIGLPTTLNDAQVADEAMKLSQFLASIGLSRLTGQARRKGWTFSDTMNIMVSAGFTMSINLLCKVSLKTGEAWLAEFHREGLRAMRESAAKREVEDDKAS